MSAQSEVVPPFGPPDCPWKSMDSQSAKPENALYQNGKLNGDNVYVGRVNDGKCVYIGTAVPSKGVCHYVNKDSELKSSNSYEILTVDCGDPLMFVDDLDHDLLFVAGCDGDEIFYPARHVDGSNTYYGWVSKEGKIAYVPRDSKLGSPKIEKDYEVMIHRYLDRLCICPPCPQPPSE